MGIIFEFKVGKGKLLVCTAQLNLIKGKPEAQTLYKSLIDYMRSDDFKPRYEVQKEELLKVLRMME